MLQRTVCSLVALLGFFLLALGSVDTDDDASAAAAANYPGFGTGVSGVYVGTDRGAGAMAGGQTVIEDSVELDVFFPDGTYRRRLPVRGLAADPAWERRQQPVLWGTWQQSGSRIVVRRGSYQSTYTVEADGSLTSDRGRPWVRVPAQDGTRFDGTFARADYRDASAPRITLRSDGSYQESGNFMHMVGGIWHLVVPDGDANSGRWTDAQANAAMAGGHGTYSFEGYTLTLRSQDGRTWQVNAWMPPGESPYDTRQLVINGYLLYRD